MIQHDLELVFPGGKVTEPILCRMGRAHDVVFNIVSANVSPRRGAFTFSLIGEEEQVQAAEGFLRAQGVEVRVTRSGPPGTAPPAHPRRVPRHPGEPHVARKLWITFLDDLRREPVTWEMMQRFDVTFDVRQSSTGTGVSIMAILLEGPESHVDGAIEFLRYRGAEVEPIEKSVVEG